MHCSSLEDRSDVARADRDYLTYHVAKAFGFLPFTGGYATLPLLYSALLWTFYTSSGIYMTVRTYRKTKNVPSEYSVPRKIIFIEVLLKFVVGILSTAFSAQRSLGFNKLADRFRRLDDRFQFRGHTAFPPQMFYSFYLLFAVVYDFASTLMGTSSLPYTLLPWNVLCSSTMLAVIQYVTYIRMLEHSYRSANRIFTNSTIKNISPDTAECMYPREINNLFIELGGLTDDVKNYFSYHVILIVIETVLIMVSGVTSLTINYLNELDTTFMHNGYFMGHCALRLFFLFCVIRENHKTVLEASNTALIGHEALTLTSDIEVILLNCWKHPVMFDVLDFFDLDYKLLQSIIASVVTYVVVLVQIQIAIMDE